MSAIFCFHERRAMANTPEHHTVMAPQSWACCNSGTAWAPSPTVPSSNSHTSLDTGDKLYEEAKEKLLPLWREALLFHPAQTHTSAQDSTRLSSFTHDLERFCHHLSNKKNKTTLCAKLFNASKTGTFTSPGWVFFFPPSSYPLHLAYIETTSRLPC